MNEYVLLTGGTGLLGTSLAARLIQKDNVTVYALVRARDGAEGTHRLKGLWHHDEALSAAIGTHVIPVPGDFTKPGLGLSRADASLLTERITLVIHAGAEVGFTKSREELKTTNYTGTGNLLAFAKRMSSLRRFVFISTAYTAGTRTGVVKETDPAPSSFLSYYEKTKAKTEELVRSCGLPYAICRPGMIVGDSVTGWVRNFNTIYYVLKRLLLGRMPVLPVRADTKLNIVPVDYTADCILQIAFAEEADGRAFHLTCPEAAAPKAGELAEYVRGWAREHLSVTIPKPAFIPMPALRKAGAAHNARRTAGKKNDLDTLLTLVPYFFGAQTFDRTNTDSVCTAAFPEWQGFIDSLLDFACRKNFMRQSGMTVFEQAKVRRASTHYPVCYYNVSDSGIQKVTGPEANRQIDRIVSALLSHGIRKGDRIALTGINSVEYMTLEQAIGLVGAVSVPIYYTTPAAEVSLLLSKSGASWFFIGDRRMMRQVQEIQTSARIVAFSEGLAEAAPQVMRWEAFMEKAGSGDAGQAVTDAPDPEDLATIRYTSGTTGEPKGVMFNFGQLAWMGEVLTNLLPWEDRNRYMSYLSFLPLSHVVEGILASYAPYYLLAKVDYYYLNDFGSLTDALPKVRPTVFFSVPRFYEKVWEQVTSNRLGRLWMSAKDGPAREAMGALLRTAVLKKAGIDRCRQLIVGSAPVSEALLLHFRELGIEVHNAYGQTEAPLITINRLGDNVIPTIGTPLPETDVTAEEDGELIVRGPQVALGYYGLETETIRDGVLRTGDLGVIHENGHITLFGRKKDFIITAYGKNISIPKIEERLKDIPGISEAVLIGENRPYCTALLWQEHDIPDLQEQINAINETLSHPEQIRRYRVIGAPLSIAAGELTPNLKVKRAVVEEHFKEIIGEMYQ